MRKLFLFLAGIFLLASCSEITPSEEKLSDEQQIAEDQRYEEFAKILSAALANNEALRDFLKKEALSEFDRDYDVFYPLAKVKDVVSGLSFEELLQRYDHSGKLKSITTSLPYLDILIPDWSWTGAFV